MSGAISEEPALSSQLVIPPYMRSVRGGMTTTAFFPLYFERHGGPRRELFVPAYYFKRSPELDVDVALALIWSLRGPGRNTFVLPPFYTHRNGKDWGVGLLPIFSTGVFSGHHHTVIPALLTWIDGDANTRHTLIGPYFNFRDHDERFWGLFPILWGKRDGNSGSTVVPPIFWRFTEDDPLSITTVVPPFYHKVRKDEKSWGLVPLVFGSRAPLAHSLTVPFLLFHYAKTQSDFRLVTPLLSYLDGKDGKSWFTPVYQRKRGVEGFDAVAPFFFHTWDDRDMSRGMFVPPFYFRWTDPANDTLAIFPFVLRTYHAGISKGWLTPLAAHFQSLDHKDHTWWVLPTFHYAWDATSWQFNIHPLVYRKQAPDHSHLAIAPIWYDFHDGKSKTHRRVILPLWWNFKNFEKQTFNKALAPLYWDFEDKKRETRRIVGFPLYWDFRNGLAKAETRVVFPFYLRLERGSSVGHGVLNTYYESKNEPSNKSWQFHFFPLLSLGGGQRGKEDDSWWSFLYGLAGYERRGPHRRVTAFWLPFNMKE